MDRYLRKALMRSVALQVAAERGEIDPTVARAYGESILHVAMVGQRYTSPRRPVANQELETRAIVVDTIPVDTSNVETPVVETLTLEDTLEMDTVVLPDESSWEVEELHPDGYLTRYTYTSGTDVLGLEYRTLPNKDPIIEVFSYENGRLEAAFWYQKGVSFPEVLRGEVTNLWNTWQGELEDLEEHNVRAYNAIGLLRELDVLVNCTIGMP
jgi:hypothetical protein